MNFVKRVFTGEVDESVHQQFIRFGKGDYRGRFLLGMHKTSKIKIKSSFEFANDFVILCSSFGNLSVSGDVLSRKDVSNVLSENNIQGESKKKAGVYSNTLSKQDLTSDQIKILLENSYFALLDIEGEGFILKTKKKLPKPGKNEDKVDDKFCQLEINEKYYPSVKEDLFWDMPDAKKIIIKHEVIINEIVMPQGEKDFAKIREMAKRKGKIMRRAEVDGKDIIKEVEFEA